MKSAGKARNNGLYRHIRTSKEIIRNLLNDSKNFFICRFLLHTELQKVRDEDSTISRNGSISSQLRFI